MVGGCWRGGFRGLFGGQYYGVIHGIIETHLTPMTHVILLRHGYVQFSASSG